MGLSILSLTATRASLAQVGTRCAVLAVDVAVITIVVMSIAGAVVSCAEPATPKPGIEVDTLQGGRVLISNPDYRPNEGLDEWHLSEELRIGVVDGESPELFGDIVSLASDRLGRIYVADLHAAEIRVFDSLGRFLRRFGSKGEGPGEFRLLLGGITLLWQHPDLLWVADAPQLIAFDSLGKVVSRGSHRIGLSTHWSGQLDSSGYFYDRNTLAAWEAGSGGVARRFIVRYESSRDGEFMGIDTLDLPDVATKARVDRDDRSVQQAILEVVSVPMQPSILWAVNPIGHVWLANSSSYRMHEVTFSGDTLRTVELKRSVVRLEGTERDSLAAESGFAASELPEFKLALKSVQVAPDGWIWLETTQGPPGVRWDLFDPCGHYLGVVRAPSDLDVGPLRLLRSSAALGVIKGEFDVEYVVRFRLWNREGMVPQASEC